jgi:hypothetical protein
MKRTSKSKKQDRSFNKRILILCEGETECAYFKSFKSDCNLRTSLAAVDIVAYQPTDFSPLGLVKEAKQQKKEAERNRNPFESIWIVFDKDGHYGIPNAFQEALDAGINKAFSSICFEFWIILHFEFTTRAFKDSDEAVSYIRGNHYSKYKKGQESFAYLRDKVGVAIHNAQRICQQVDEEINYGRAKLHECNPFTNVHYLVNELLSINKK